MSERTRTLAFATALLALATVLVVLITTTPSEVDRVESIGQRIKCPVCQGESIADSPSAIAGDMMDLVADRVDAGLSDETIVDELLSSYSGSVLLDPPVGGATLLLWLAPVVALVMGVTVIVWWRRHPRQTQELVGVAKPRRLAPVLILVTAFAGVVLLANSAIRDGGSPATGVAALDQEDLSDVSNETMEGVIESNVDDPAIDGMRLALAERYFRSGDYSSAFPHYLAVAESSMASAEEVVAALVRLGWMVWDGNGEAETAVDLFDQALAVDGDSSTAQYLKGQVLWCGIGDTAGAEALFRDALTDPDLTDDARAEVESSLTAVRAGTGCA